MRRSINKIAHIVAGLTALVLALAACSGGLGGREESEAAWESQIGRAETAAGNPQRREPELRRTPRDGEDLAQLERLQEKVRKELVTLPWYGVFDHLQFSVRGDVVTLSGYVTRPTLKSDAEDRVARLEEVSEVVNNIEVLPLSFHDDDIRRAVYRAIFTKPGLDRYALGARPSIHIIVKDGHVILEGQVSREADKHQAGMAAGGVSPVFSVTNNLKVQRRG